MRDLASKRVGVGGRGVVAILAALTLLVGVGAAEASFVTFESGQVRPLALTPDGLRLLAVNTPDNRLEIFDVDGTGGLTHGGAVPLASSRSRSRSAPTEARHGS